MKRITIATLLLLVTTAVTKAQTGPVYNPYPKTITVSGSADMEVVPDEIYVQVLLREYDKKGSGKIDIEKIKSDFLKSCKEIGLPDSTITVASMSGYGPWWKKKKKNPDLYASITYEIKFSSPKKIDELVEKLDDEAVQNFYIARVEHSKIKEFKKQLKIEAVKAAKEKAKYLSEAIGEEIGPAISINEPEPVTIRPYYQTANVMLKEAAVADQVSSDESNIQYKKIKLEFNVTVVFALK